MSVCLEISVFGARLCPIRHLANPHNAKYIKHMWLFTTPLSTPKLRLWREDETTVVQYSLHSGPMFHTEAHEEKKEIQSKNSSLPSLCTTKLPAQREQDVTFWPGGIIHD
jgi:hypothetical protein